MSNNIRWQEAEGRLHAYALPVQPGLHPRPPQVGDSFTALGHREPVTISRDDVDPGRKARLGPIPTSRDCDVAARKLIGVPLWGYEESDVDPR